ncbi:MAG TPA: DUF4012 domain-containing protein [bacterium]|nr:DUF4012 domain-containing protein [bacterium]
MNDVLLTKNKNRVGRSSLARTIMIIMALVLAAFFLLVILVFFKMKLVYTDISSGRQNLNYALTYISEGNFNKASLSANQASKYFSSAEKTLIKLQNNFFIKNIDFLNNNLNDFKYLSQTAEILSSSAEEALSLINDINTLLSGQTVNNFASLSVNDKIIILKKLYENYPEMQGIKANIDLGIIYLQKIKDNKFLSSYTDSINGLEEKLINVSESLGKIISLSAIIPVISGYPQPASYLIILQNNNELRPTGGFIGTYGILEITAGEITKLETYDSYHLDMPSSLKTDFKVEPPEALKKYLGIDYWYLRDANWSPDWPSSAQKIKWFYEQEMTKADRSDEIINFSGIIAITPRMITDLLYFVGPIEIDGQNYNKDNFTEVLQYEVEMAFKDKNISEWDRKSVINDILEELKNRLFNLPADKWIELANILNQNIERKNIFVYLTDNYSQEVVANLNWGGEIKENKLDYLMVVDANLAAFKTDRVMDKRIKYYLDEESDGRFKARVELKYKNNGWFDWQTTRYRTFTRVYVPANSSFVNVSGLSENIKTDTYDDEILNPKTYWSGFISIEPGQESIITFEYYLPDNISKMITVDNNYSLFLQKQAGNNTNQFEAEFNFLKPIKTINGEGEIKVEKNKVYWKNDLAKDYNIEISF